MTPKEIDLENICIVLCVVFSPSFLSIKIINSANGLSGKLLWSQISPEGDTVLPGMTYSHSTGICFVLM